MTDEKPQQTPAEPAQEPGTGSAAPEAADPPGGSHIAPVPDEERALLVENPDEPRPYTEDEVRQDGPVQLSAAAAETARSTGTLDLPDAPRTRAQQFAFLRAAHNGPAIWHNLCQKLAHEAPGIPALAPSALAAAHMVPPEDRVHHVHRLRRGMVLFFDDPNDDNPFAHVVSVAGWLTSAPTDDLHDLITWSPDAARFGGVDLVRASFFRESWGDPMLFGSTSINGYDLPGYGAAGDVPAAKHPTLRETLDRAEAAVRRGIRAQRARGHHRKVAALLVDLAEMEDTRRKLVAG